MAAAIQKRKVNIVLNNQDNDKNEQLKNFTKLLVFWSFFRVISAQGSCLRLYAIIFQFPGMFFFNQ